MTQNKDSQVSNLGYQHPMCYDWDSLKSKKCKEINKQHLFKLKAAVYRFPQLLLTAHRKNTSLEVLLGRKAIFCIVLFFLTLDWENLLEALIL